MGGEGAGKVCEGGSVRMEAMGRVGHACLMVGRSRSSKFVEPLLGSVRSIQASDWTSAMRDVYTYLTVSNRKVKKYFPGRGPRTPAKTFFGMLIFNASPRAHQKSHLSSADASMITLAARCPSTGTRRVRTALDM